MHPEAALHKIGREGANRKGMFVPIRILYITLSKCGLRLVSDILE